MCSPPPRTPPGVCRTAAMSIEPRNRSSRSIRRRRGIWTRRSRSTAMARISCCTTRSPTSGSSSTPGDPVDAEAWRRGVTVYLPGRRAPLYPPVLSEAAASLLPDGPRPSVVFTVRVRPDGDARLDGVERAMVHSRAKLGYDTVATEELPDGFAELARRVEVAEERRECRPGRVSRAGAQPHRRRSGPALPAAQRERGPERRAVTRHEPRRRRRAPRRRHGTVPGDAGARRAGDPPPAPQRHGVRVDVAGAISRSADFARTLRREDPRHAAFLLAVRKASGGASYAAHRDGATPWHAAVARDVRPCHRPDAPPRRPLRHRGGPRRRQRPAGAGRRAGRVRRTARGDGARPRPAPIGSTPPCSISPRR